MEVTFRKSDDRKHLVVWSATKGKTRIPGSVMGCHPRHLPHDIVTLVIERELGITDGFFATVEAGGTFRSMAKRRHAAGKAVIAGNRVGLQRSEHVVNRVWDDWRAGRDTACNAALDAADEAWRALPPGGELTLTWPASRRCSTGKR